jgi:hypothetical protein
MFILMVPTRRNETDEWEKVDDAFIEAEGRSPHRGGSREVRNSVTVSAILVRRIDLVPLAHRSLT